MTTASTNYDRTHDRHMSSDDVASFRERTQWLRRTSWGAILVGAVSAIGLQALFTVLGTAIGASSFGGSGTEVENVGMFAGIWWVISGIISLSVGGMMVGRMISIPRNAELIVHGFTMWAVTAIFGFLFLWSSAGMVGEVGAQSVNMTSQTQAAQPAEQAVSSAVASTSAEQVRESASAASWWVLVALLLGVGAAIGGTYIGAAPLGQQDHDDDD